MRLYADIEANGFLEAVTRIWCVAAIDLDTGQKYSWGPHQIKEALETLSRAELLVGHNFIRYDLPVLKKVMGWTPMASCLILDTYILAQLAYSDIRSSDDALVAKGVLKSNEKGKHSLKVWGKRLGVFKDEYEGGFDEWSQEMQDYCLQDNAVGVALWEYLKVHELDARSVELEHRATTITFEMEQAGWPFDEQAAGRLYTELTARHHEIETALVARFGSWQEVDKIFVPKRDDKKRGYTKGVEVTKYKTVTFNPGSRQHIIKKLTEAGWKPEVFTDSGQAKLDEDILEELNVPEAKELVEYLLIQKRLGQLGDGKQGWLKQVRHGKVHASYNTMGTVTGRCSHFSPNIAQVPKVKKDKQGNILKGHEGGWSGWECRALFGVPKGWKLIGADFEGLELRCLAHYMATRDDGEYARTVADGDIHTVNQQAARLPTRENAKTFIYGFLYGAGDEKIGKIVGKGRVAGKMLKEQFLNGLPALKWLRQIVISKARDNGKLKGLDGRYIPVRAAHASLNSLLQSAGAVLCKTWLVDTYDTLIANGHRWGWEGDFVIVGFIHDELQIAVRESLCHTETIETKDGPEEVLRSVIGDIVIACARDTGPKFNFKCRLDSKYVVGDNWKDTH
jgi:DNA polymerase I-like protein with 3'-5' exonuclease and polymerase domains